MSECQVCHFKYQVIDTVRCDICNAICCLKCAKGHVSSHSVCTYRITFTIESNTPISTQELAEATSVMYHALSDEGGPLDGHIIKNIEMKDEKLP